MQVSEHELELLEQYLDGALAPEQAAELRRRVAEEPALTEAIEQLRLDRALRQQVWQSLEPAANTEKELADRILLRARAWSAPQRQPMRRWRIVQHLATAAACIIIGFALSWAWQRSTQQGPGGNAVGTGVASATPDGSYPMQFVSGDLQPADEANSIGPSQVVVTDPSGQVTDVRSFATRREAQDFVEKLTRARVRLGVAIQTVPAEDPLRQRVAALGNEPALRVREVVKDSPAAKAGVRSGDIILGLDGKRVTGAPAFSAAIASHKGPIDLQILRDAETSIIRVELPEK